MSSAQNTYSECSPSPFDGPTQPAAPRVRAPELARALEEARDELERASEREAVLLATIDELALACQEAHDERDAFEETVEELTAARFAALRSEAKARQTPPPMPNRSKPARPARRRPTTSSFRRAFGERRLSVLGQEPPDALDAKAARKLRASRISARLLVGLAVGLLVGTVALVSGLEQLRTGNDNLSTRVQEAPNYASTTADAVSETKARKR